MIRTAGRAVEKQNCTFVVTDRPPVDNLADTVEVLWHDSRSISPEQRRKAYALMGEIAEWSGDDTGRVKAAMKVDFRRKTLETLNDELFSLSDCDMTTARNFISFLIAFILENDVPTHVPLATLADDIQRYVYACTVNKKCAVCGKKAELHHVDRIGMGGDRRNINHIGMRCLPLCRIHHMEAHDHGDERLMSAEHLEPIVIDEKIAKIYRLGLKK